VLFGAPTTWRPVGAGGGGRCPATVARTADRACGVQLHTPSRPRPQHAGQLAAQLRGGREHAAKVDSTTSKLVVGTQRLLARRRPVDLDAGARACSGGRRTRRVVDSGHRRAGVARDVALPVPQATSSTVARSRPRATTSAHFVITAITSNRPRPRPVPSVRSSTHHPTVVAECGHAARRFPEASTSCCRPSAACSPDHEAAAASWPACWRRGPARCVQLDAAGAIGEFFATVAGHLPPPPAPTASPTLWGTEEHVRELLAPAGLEPAFVRETITFRFPSAPLPSRPTRRSSAGRQGARAARAAGAWEPLREDLRQLFEQTTPPLTGRRLPAEYLVVTA